MGVGARVRGEGHEMARPWFDWRWRQKRRLEPQFTPHHTHIPFAAHARHTTRYVRPPRPDMLRVCTARVARTAARGAHTHATASQAAFV